MQQKIFYRAEIDGLRAIAVTMVLLYHAGFTFEKINLFSGGYIGVDIFFVISGYLISKIIFVKIKSNNFSFTEFYINRAKRILPALIFVIFLCSFVAIKIYLPVNLIEYSKSIIYSLFFSSNVYFHYSGKLYGAESSLLLPFLHTWSLAIEEQFYIIFPLFLLILIRYFKNYQFYLLFACFIISIVFAHWASIRHPSFNFYFISSRLWELILGALIVITEKSININKFNKNLPTIGFLLIIISFFIFNHNTLHPSLITLFPVIGVCMIIYFANEKDYIIKILSSKLLVSIGLISYSIYLWHFPIFAFARELYLFEKINYKIIFIIFTLILSLITYRYIEQPFRKKLSNKTIFINLIILFFILFFVNLNIIFKKGYPNRFNKNISSLSTEFTDHKIFQDKNLCHNRKGDQGFCIFNSNEKNNKKIILLGDSMVNSLTRNLIERINNKNFELINTSYGGNIYLPGYVKMEKNKKNYIVSDVSWHESRQNVLNDHKDNSYVVIFYDYMRYFEKKLTLSNSKVVSYDLESKFIKKENFDLDYNSRTKLLKKKLQKTIEEIAQNHNVILIYPLPQPPRSVLKNIKNNYLKGLFQDENYYLKDPINYDYKIYLNFNKKIIETLDNIKGKNINRIYLDDLICDENKCFFYNNKNYYVYDNLHPTYSLSKIINDRILKYID